MTIIPGKNAILVTDAGIGFDVFDFSSGTNASSKSSVVAIDGQSATCWSSFSPSMLNLSDVVFLIYSFGVQRYEELLFDRYWDLYGDRN